MPHSKTLHSSAPTSSNIEIYIMSDHNGIDSANPGPASDSIAMTNGTAARHRVAALAALARSIMTFLTGIYITFLNLLRVLRPRAASPRQESLSWTSVLQELLVTNVQLLSSCLAS